MSGKGKSKKQLAVEQRRREKVSSEDIVITALQAQGIPACFALVTLCLGGDGKNGGRLC